MDINIINFFYPLLTGTIKTIFASALILLLLILTKRHLKPSFRIVLAFVAVCLFPVLTTASFLQPGRYSAKLMNKREVVQHEFQMDIHANSYVQSSLLKTKYSDALERRENLEKNETVIKHITKKIIPFNAVNLRISDNVKNFIVGFWLFGAVIYLVRIVTRRKRLHKKIGGYKRLYHGDWFDSLQLVWERNGVGHMPDLFNGEEEGPFIIHINRKIAVVVPEQSSQWTKSEQYLAMLHECAHILRNDVFLLAVAEVLSALVWHIPYCKFFLHSIEVDRELACDDMAISAGAKRREYASMLLEITRRQAAISSMPGAVAGISGISNIERRIKMILQKDKKTKIIPHILTISLVFIMLVSVIVFVPSLFAEPLPIDNFDDGQLLVHSKMMTINTVTPYKIANRINEEVRILAPEIYNVNDLPMASPVSGPDWKITHPFGTQMHPILKQLYIHPAIDIAGEYGAPVMATIDGTVVSIGFQKSGYGKYILLRQGNLITAYMHLGEIHVKEGQAVSIGAVIGTCGSTGLSTGPHLHYEVFMVSDEIEQLESKTELGYPGGIWLDPLPMIATSLF